MGKGAVLGLVSSGCLFRTVPSRVVCLENLYPVVLTCRGQVTTLPFSDIS